MVVSICQVGCISFYFPNQTTFSLLKISPKEKLTDKISFSQHITLIQINFFPRLFLPARNWQTKNMCLKKERQSNRQ
jgi:hypothetical protein